MVFLYFLIRLQGSLAVNFYKIEREFTDHGENAQFTSNSYIGRFTLNFQYDQNELIVSQLTVNQTFDKKCVLFIKF